jgi:hypothetical protein
MSSKPAKSTQSKGGCMRQQALILVLFILSAKFTAQARIINIPADYSTIQSGIDASSNGDTVLVQPGTYLETISFGGHNIQLASLFLTSGDISYISSTIIDGHNAGTVVTFENGEDSTSSITGFTIQNGYWDGGGGGGILCDYASPKINYNIIRYNYARWGGAIELLHSSSYVSNNLIYENEKSDGAGIESESSNAVIINCTITRNNGSGISLYRGHVKIRNTISWGNRWRGIFFYGFPDSAKIDYCLFTEDHPGEGNMVADPMFRNPGQLDFHLMSTACGDAIDSPGIDAGDPGIYDSLLNCIWGLGTERSDIGAFGMGNALLTEINEDMNPQIPAFIVLSQNYPNPFNPVTTIEYYLPEPSAVTLDIYDILGRKIETVVNGNQAAGHHTVFWNAIRNPSGVYFYRLKAGDFSLSKKMLLLK